MTKKIKISVLMVVWSIVAIQIYVNYQEKLQKESRIVTAFSVAQDTAQEEIISGYGYFGTMKLSEATKEKMLENLAYKLGITDGYTFQDGNGEEFEKKVLIKEGKHAVTTLQVISILGNPSEPEQYIVMEIRTKEKIEDVVSLYQKMKRTYEEIGVDGKVTLEVAMEKEGNLQTTDRETLTNHILDLIQAKKVDSIMKNEIVTVYGYTKLEDSYLELNGKKINVQIVMSYDEDRDKTYVKIGVPIVNTSY